MENSKMLINKIPKHYLQYQKRFKDARTFPPTYDLFKKIEFSEKR